MNNYLNELVANVVNSWESNSHLYYNALDDLATYCEDNDIAFPLDEVASRCEELYPDKKENIKNVLMLDLESCGSF